MVGSASGPGSTFMAFLGSARVRVPLSNFSRIFGPVKTSNQKDPSIRNKWIVYF